MGSAEAPRAGRSSRRHGTLAATALVLAAFALAPTAAAEADLETLVDGSDPVVALTQDTFDNALKTNSRMLVEFYAPWCGHCKQLEPEYKKVAEEMKAERLETVLAKVDATKEAELAQRYGIQGYPSLQYFKTGESEPTTYEGERTAPAIKTWLRKREMPAVSQVETGGEQVFFQSVPTDGYAVLAKVVKKSARAKVLAKAAESLLETLTTSVKFGAVSLPKGADPKGADVSLTMFRAGFSEPDAEQITYTGKWTEGNIAEWIKASLFPLVGNKLPVAKASELYVSAIQESGVVAVTVSGEDARKEAVKALVDMAKAETGWKFTAVDRTGTLDTWGITAWDGAEDKNAIITLLKGDKKYVRTVTEMSLGAAVAAFLADFKAKKVKPHYKSAPVPEVEQDADGITTLVGSTFESFVLDSKRDVFVEFYAPWCGHCKKLEPIWHELAKHAKKSGWLEKGLVIAKMDGTLNECDEEVAGYPALILYPAVATKKKFQLKVVYSGQRELDPLKEFVLNTAQGLEDAGDVGAKKSASILERERAKKKQAKAADKEL